MMRSFSFLFLFLSFICNHSFAENYADLKDSLPRNNYRNEQILPIPAQNRKAPTQTRSIYTSEIEIEEGFFYDDYEYGMRSTTNYYQHGTRFYISVANLCNNTGYTYSGELRVGLFSKNGDLKNSVNTYYFEIRDLPTNYMTRRTDIECYWNDIYEEGDYLAIITKKFGSNSTWKKVNGEKYSQYELPLKGGDKGLLSDELILTHSNSSSNSDKISLDDSSIKVGKKFYVKNGYFRNATTSSFSGKVGVALYNQNDDMVELVSTQTINLSYMDTGYGTRNNGIACVIAKPHNEKCYLSLCYMKSGQNSWKRMKAVPNITSKIQIPEIRENDLADITSVSYDSETKQITIKTDKNINYYLYDSYGNLWEKNRSNYQGFINFRYADIPDGIWKLKLERNAEEVFINLKFK